MRDMIPSAPGPLDQPFYKALHLKKLSEFHLGRRLHHSTQLTLAFGEA
jgi:hypothetical protein